MDTIDAAVMTKAAEFLDTLDPSKVGEVHTVTVTLDGHTGGCRMTVENSLADDVWFDIR
jgi:glutamine cyclotransferase